MKAKTELKKSGLVVLVGRSNVGKSSLMNALVGTKIAITTPKPQTTRHIIQGVVNDPRGQIVLADTPGVFGHVPDLMTSRLNAKAHESVEGVDAILYVVDPTRHVGQEEETVHRLVKGSKKPKIMVINKADEKLPYIDEYMAWRDEFTAIVQVSAVDGTNLKGLIDAIFEVLPDGEPLYPPDRITDLDNNFWLAELIREKVFMNMHEEVPYTTTVQIDEMTERKNGVQYIKATIYTTSLRYKKMIIGERAMAIKRIGSQARKELEEVTGKKVFLELEVAVEERWQERFE
jgi:GTP-binding protein Era